MKRIVVIGNSWTAVSAVRRIMEQEQCEVTVFSAEGMAPYRRDRMLDCLAAGKILPELAALDEKESNALPFTLNDQTIVRVNFRKQIVVTQDKAQVPYDVLIIADTETSRFPEIKGTHRNGVFGLRRKSDLLVMLKALPVIETVVIPLEDAFSVQLAAAFQKRGKEVLLINASSRIFFAADTEDSRNTAAQALAKVLDQNGIRVVCDARITEVLGDSEVKAVRLSNGKVIAAQMVVFPRADVELKLFKGTDLDFDQDVKVQSLVKTNVEGVFSVAPAGGMITDYGSRGYADFSLAQSGALAALLTGQDAPEINIADRWDAKINSVPLTCLGAVWKKDSADRTVLLADDEDGFAQVFLKEGIVRGGFFINREEDVSRAVNMVRERAVWPEPAPEIPGENAGELSGESPGEASFETAPQEQEEDTAGAPDPVADEAPVLEPVPPDTEDEVPPSQGERP